MTQVEREQLTFEALHDKDGLKVSKSPWGPDDEIGRSSVKPCTRPSTSACQSGSFDGSSPQPMRVRKNATVSGAAAAA